METSILICFANQWTGFYMATAGSRCVLVPFERYWRPKKMRSKSSCNTVSIYISRKTKGNIVHKNLKIKTF